MHSEAPTAAGNGDLGGARRSPSNSCRGAQTPRSRRICPSPWNSSRRRDLCSALGPLDRRRQRRTFTSLATAPPSVDCLGASRERSGPPPRSSLWWASQTAWPEATNGPFPRAPSRTPGPQLLCVPKSTRPERASGRRCNHNWHNHTQGDTGPGPRRCRACLLRRSFPRT